MSEEESKTCGVSDEDLVLCWVQAGRTHPNPQDEMDRLKEFARLFAIESAKRPLLSDIGIQPLLYSYQTPRRCADNMAEAMESMDVTPSGVFIDVTKMMSALSAYAETYREGCE